MCHRMPCLTCPDRRLGYSLDYLQPPALLLGTFPLTFLYHLRDYLFRGGRELRMDGDGLALRLMLCLCRPLLGNKEQQQTRRLLLCLQRGRLNELRHKMAQGNRAKHPMERKGVPAERMEATMAPLRRLPLIFVLFSAAEPESKNDRRAV